MIGTRLAPAARRCITATAAQRTFSTSRRLLKALPVQVTATGRGTQQTISCPGKPYSFQTDTYPVLGGKDSAPSPVAYCMASLGSCNQVTGAVVARDHGIKLGEWKVDVTGMLPTDVLVAGKQGNPNWESVEVKVRVQTDVTEKDKFDFFVSEVERRCPITALFKLSGVGYKSEWVNEPIPEES